MKEFTTDLSAQIEGDMIAMLDEWGALPEVWDNALTSQIHGWYVNPPNVWPKKPYFSPSALSSCPRELYVKAKGAKRDVNPQRPYQNRWKKLGTSVGDFIQSELLFIEKHFEAMTGNKPRFKFLRDSEGRPRLEEFAKANKKVTHNGETFYLYGSPDGVMTYTTDAGEEIRVGLEIKSKQTTPARTSHYSLKEADSSHFIQTVAYAEMFGCDYYVVLYVNCAKQSWNMTDEQYAKTPDIRAFCRKITPEMKAAEFVKPAMVTKAVRDNTPPPLDIDKFLFNNFKTACALDLSDEEFTELLSVNNRMQHSNLKDGKKRDYAAAIEFISETRKGTL